MVREKRETETQNLGFSSRPFVLCGLPVKRPKTGCLLHKRRNGQFVLQVTGHPSYGLPWGQDRLVPIFLATIAIRQQTPRITFDSAAGMLDIFGMQQGGSQYRRLVDSGQIRRGNALPLSTARGSISWPKPGYGTRVIPIRSSCRGLPNMIVLSDEFYREISSHPIPTDLEAAKALSASPAALDLFTWLSYRCFTARGRERVPLFGDYGLVSQLGSADYSRPRKFR
jgi:hypothetical protein